MGIGKKDIEELRSVLLRADESLEEDGRMKRDFADALYVTLLTISREKIYELSPEVYGLLNSSNFMIRANAIETLGFITRLHLPEFKERAYQIWLEDEDEYVRSTALRAWSDYYRDSADPKAMAILYRILIDESHPSDIRYEAMCHIFDTCNEIPEFFQSCAGPFRDWSMETIHSHEALNRKIDWPAMKALVQKYAPSALMG